MTQSTEQDSAAVLKAGQAWFSTASLGLFIHFDQASQLGLDLSWPIVDLTSDNGTGVKSTVPVDYLRVADSFDPDRWDPADIVRRAKAAGATYAVFTTKHHSGWASWPSLAAPLNISSCPFGSRGGDLVRDFVAACREEGLRVGLYFSLSDWSDPDYPAWRPEFAPYSFENYPRSSPEQWSRYRARMKAELGELLTNYGQIDLLWFDGGWERTADEWGSAELETFIRSHQPNIVINDRLPGAGDYKTPEQTLPNVPITGPWETCVTMNDSWGWDPADLNYKSSASLLRMLVEVVAKGGSLLLNVGPDRHGAIPPEEAAILADIAKWMAVHRSSVIGARGGLAPWQFYGPTTIAGDDLFLHLVAWPYEHATVRGLRVKHIEAVDLITTGEAVPFSTEVDPAHARETDPVGAVRITLPPERPDTLLPVLRIRFRGSADQAVC